MAGWLNPNDPNSGAELLTQEQIAKQQEIAAKMLAAAGKARPMTSPWQAVAQAAEGAFAGLRARDATAASANAAAYDRGLLSGDLGVAAPAVTVAPVVAGGTAEPVATAGAVPAPVATPAALAPTFARAENQYGLPTNYLPQVAKIESNFNTNAKNPNSSAGGLFQFIDPTAKQYGLTNKFDPVASTDAAARLAADNKQILARTLGRDPTAGELYLAHQQGAGGASKLLANPDARAVDIVGRNAVRLNGGHEGMSAGEFSKKWVGKVAAADLPAEGATPVAMEAGNQGFAIPGEDPAKLRADAEYYAQSNPEAARQLMARADAAEAASVPAAPPAPPMPMPVAAQPAPPMNGNTFNSIQAGGMEPVFQSEGVAQPWMNTAIPPAASPSARVAQAMQSAPMPPPRPAGLTTAQADLPAPGAVPAIGQMPPAAPAMPDLSNTPDGGARILQVLSEQQRQGQAPAPGMPQAGLSAAIPVAQASLPAAAAPVAPATPVERVAAAQAAAQGGTPAAGAPASPAVAGVASALQGVNPRVLAAATSPYASPQTKAVAQVILKQQLEAAERNNPATIEKNRLANEGQALTNAKTRRELEGEGATPLTEQERTAFNVPKGQAAFKTRSGDIKFGPAGTTVKNEGAIPPGYRAERDADGNVTAVTPIPGSKVAQALEAQEKATKAQAGLVLGAIDSIEKTMSGATLPTTGGVGSYLSSVPGTAAHDVKNSLETVEANISFERLNQMRAASPTGAALGSVTERELSLLGSSLAALKQSQSEKQFRQNLGTVKEAYQDIIHGPGNRPKAEPDAPGAMKAGEVRKGYRFKGGDPSKRDSWEKAE